MTETLEPRVAWRCPAVGDKCTAAAQDEERGDTAISQAGLISGLKISIRVESQEVLSILHRTHAKQPRVGALRFVWFKPTGRAKGSLPPVFPGAASARPSSQVCEETGLRRPKPASAQHAAATLGQSRRGEHGAEAPSVSQPLTLDFHSC